MMTMIEKSTNSLKTALVNDRDVTKTICSINYFTSKISYYNKISHQSQILFHLLNYSRGEIDLSI